MNIDLNMLPNDFWISDSNSITWKLSNIDNTNLNESRLTIIDIAIS